MRGTRRSYVALAVMVLGFAVATLGASHASSDGLALVLAVGGTAVGYGSLLVLYFVYDDEIFPSFQPYDERTKRLERYTTRNSWFALVAALVAAMLSEPYLPEWFGDFLLPLVLMFGMIVFGASWSWYERQM